MLKMPFTTYYSKVLLTKGLPQLSLDQHKRLFNIISLESRLDELSRMKTSMVPNEQLKAHYYRTEFLNKQLEELTFNTSPEDLMEDMLRKSDQDY